jgi:glycosyltransferase involved in cell wall biosynthesis
LRKNNLKQKLILINGRFMSQPITGVQRYAREVIAALVKSGETQFKFIIAIPDRNSFEPIPDTETFHDNSFLQTAIWQQVRLPLLMKKLRADLLWSPCNIGPLFAENHVITMHDAATFAGPEWFSPSFRTYYSLIFPLLGRRARRVLTSSLFSKKEIVKYGIAAAEKIRVIPGGVSPQFTHTSSKIFDFPYILTVGSRDPRKNSARLIESWNKLPADVKKKRRLVIAGREIHSFSSEGYGKIPDDVHFTGYMSDNNLPVLYSGADAFVFPSLYEGFGLPPLEAMACGCSVICSKTASLPEVCGDAAYYIDPYSIESITDGMRKVLTDDTLRQALHKKGLERVKLFSWEKSAEEHIRNFEELTTVRQ